MKSISYDTPGPGLYPDVPPSIYHAWDGASNSRLGDLLRSPAHCWEAMTNPKPPTPALVLGDAAHACILEADRFEQDYLVAGQCCATKGSGDRCGNAGSYHADGEWYCGVHAKAVKDFADKIDNPFSQDDYDKVRRMRDAVRNHPDASLFLDDAEDIEVSGVWIDKETGVQCKMRVDMVCPALDSIADIKTTINASRDDFEKSIFNFGYCRQGPHYLNGMAANGRVFEHFNFIVVEKEPPFAVAVYRLRDDVLEVGNEMLQKLLAKYKQCLESGVWEGYPAGVQDIGLPRWADRVIESQLEQIG